MDDDRAGRMNFELTFLDEQLCTPWQSPLNDWKQRDATISEPTQKGALLSRGFDFFLFVKTTTSVKGTFVKHELYSIEMASILSL